MMILKTHKFNNSYDCCMCMDHIMLC